MRWVGARWPHARAKAVVGFAGPLAGSLAQGVRNGIDDHWPSPRQHAPVHRRRSHQPGGRPLLRACPLRPVPLARRSAQHRTWAWRRSAVRSMWSSPGLQCHSSLAAPPAPRCRWACRCEGPGHPAPVACAARSRRDHTELTWRPREGHAEPAESAAFHVQACAAARVARRASRGAAPRRTTPAARP